MLPAADPRPGPTMMSWLSGVIDKVPDNQEIIHVAHIFDHAQLIGPDDPAWYRHRPGNALPVPSSQSFIQVAPGVYPSGTSYFGSLVTPNSISTLQRSAILWYSPCLLRIGEQSLHLFRRLNVILSALITHTILVRQLFAGLQTQQNVMRDRILLVSIVHIVGHHQRNASLLAHAQQLLVHRLLLRNAVILQLQEKIVFPRKCPGTFCARFFASSYKFFLNVTGHLSGQAGAQSDDTLVVTFFKSLLVHPRGL